MSEFSLGGKALVDIQWLTANVQNTRLLLLGRGVMVMVMVMPSYDDLIPLV